MISTFLLMILSPLCLNADIAIKEMIPDKDFSLQQMLQFEFAK